MSPNTATPRSCRSCGRDSDPDWELGIGSRALSSPPAFAWDDWYAAVGGRSIRIPEVTDLLQEIFNHQYPRFAGEIAAERRAFGSPAEASQHLKDKALEFGADIVGICEIEPSDVYRGRVITEKYAIAVGQRMRW